MLMGAGVGRACTESWDHLGPFRDVAGTDTIHEPVSGRRGKHVSVDAKRVERGRWFAKESGILEMSPAFAIECA